MRKMQTSVTATSLKNDLLSSNLSNGNLNSSEVKPGKNSVKTLESKMKLNKQSSMGIAGFRRKVTETISGHVDLDSCDPETCVSLLNFPTMKTLSSVNKKIKNNNDGWMQGFLDARGLDELLNLVESMGRRRVSQLSDALSLLECVSCIKSVLNSKLGLEYLVNHEDFTRKLVMALDTSNVMVKKQVFELMSALCVYSKHGYHLAIDAIDNYKAKKMQRYRFSVILNELKTAELITYKTAIMGIINCLLIGEDSLQERVKLRNEFIGLNLLDIMCNLRDDDDQHLNIQCDVFEDNKQSDDDEIGVKHPAVLNINDHRDLFNAILNKVYNTPDADAFLTILQIFLGINENDMPPNKQRQSLWISLRDVVQKITTFEHSPRLLRNFIEGNELTKSASKYVQTDVKTNNENSDSNKSVSENMEANRNYCDKEKTHMLQNNQLSHETFRDTKNLSSAPKFVVNSSDNSCNRSQNCNQFNGYNAKDDRLFLLESKHAIKTSQNLTESPSGSITSQSLNTNNELSQKPHLDHSDKFLNGLNCTENCVTVTQPPLLLQPQSLSSQNEVLLMPHKPLTNGVSSPNSQQQPLPPAPPPPPPLPFSQYTTKDSDAQQSSLTKNIIPPPPLPGLNCSVPTPPVMTNIIPPPPPPLPGLNSSVPPPPPMTNNIPPPPPPLPGLNSSVPPPPPPPMSYTIPPHPPPIPGLNSSIPPPPPMTNNIPPPPPPLPGINSSVPLPPTIISSVSGPPRPPPLHIPPPPPPLANGLSPLTRSQPFPTLYSCPSTITAIKSPPILTPKPRQKMRTINWIKIKPESFSKNVWEEVLEMNDKVPVRYDTLEQLFCQKEVNPPAATKSVKEKAPTEVLLLDPKRSMNVNIFLKQFRMSNSDIITMIREGRAEEIGAERLIGLQKISPDQDEIDSVNAYSKDPEKLGNAEKFYRMLGSLPYYKTRIDGMLLKLDVPVIMASLRKDVDALEAACRQLLENKSIKIFLRLVLHTGNFLNAGKYGGNAAGFQINSLNKLVDTRANKPRVTLLHHLVSECNTNNQEALSFVQVLTPALKSVERLNIDSLKTESHDLSNKLHKVEAQVNQAGHELTDIFNTFLENAKKECDEIDKDLANIDLLTKKLSNHFCENESKFKLEECLNSFKVFCEHVSQCIKENEQRKIQEEKAEKRRREREQKEAMQKPGTNSYQQQAQDEGCIIDKLLSEIRKGSKLRKSATPT